jgi:hypothetical protein
VVITQIIDVVYRIQRNTRSRMMAVHLDWLTPYQELLWMSSLKEGAVVMGGGKPSHESV